VLVRKLEIGDLFFSLTENVEMIEYSEYRESRQMCVRASILPPVAISRCLQKCVSRQIQYLLLELSQILYIWRLPELVWFPCIYYLTVSTFPCTHLPILLK